MKKLLLSILAAVCIFSANAQTTSSPDTLKKSDGKNLFKLNLTALPLKTYSVVYERAIGKKTSVGLGLRYYPEDKIPFLSKVEELIDDEETNKHLRNFKMSNFAITPEIKFYFGKDVFRGFYIAPFVRYAVYSGSLPFDFDIDLDDDGVVERTEIIPLNGNIRTFTGGITFGSQWKLSNRIYLDWFILGPHYGSSRGSIFGSTANFSAQEREELDKELKSVFEDADIPLVKINTEVNDERANVNFTGPWAGIRAGISLGIRF